MRWRRFRERRQRDEDLARELDSYIAHEFDDNLARGMPPGAAWSAAQRKFGNSTYIREDVYYMNSPHPIDGFWRDLKYGFRQLRRKPGFTITAILSLALGIGANSAIFTLVDQIVLRLLPVANPRELVQLEVAGGRFGSNDGDDVHSFSYPLYQALRDRNQVFTGLTGERIERAGMAAGDREEMIRVGFVGGNYFTVFGVAPSAGRLLSLDDDRARNGSPVAVLQYDYWKSRFSGDPGILGSNIRLGGAALTVIGVSAQGFEGTDIGVPTQVWVPATMKPAIAPPWDDLANERASWFALFGRLKPGVSLSQAQAALRVLYRDRQQEELQGAFFQQHPEMRDPFLRQTFTVIPASGGASGLRSRFAAPLMVLQWLVAVVLLIACANVANLLLARGSSRAREVAIRGALGASRRDLIRQLLIESLLLATAGGAAGVILSTWLARGLLHFLSSDPANLSLSATPDLRILLFTAATALLTAILFGLVPALQCTRVPAAATLKEEAGSVAGGQPQARLRKAFVTLQVGLCCLLLIGAGLFARTLQNLRRIDLGFQTENVVVFSVRPATLYEPSRKLQVYRTLLERLGGLPGVEAVGANRVSLLTGGRWDANIVIPGAESAYSLFNAVTPGYFEALRIPVKAGRDFRWSDWGTGAKLCLVNDALVKEYLHGANPIGRLMARGLKRTPDLEIIGIAANSRYEDVRGEMLPQTFLTMDAIIQNVAEINVHARITGDPRQLMPQFRAQVRQVDANLVVSDMRTLDEQLNRRLSNERMLSYLSMGFAFLATLLAVVGLHGVLAFVVTRRRREIGIRVALGAERGRVVWMVVREMLPAILAGMAAGVTGGLAGGRYVQSQLFGVTPLDLPVFSGSIGIVLIAAGAAALIPAWRASRIDPYVALRNE